MRTLALVAALGCSSGSGSAPQPPPPPPATPTPPPAPSWKLELVYGYGPCAADDARPCHITWTATPDGKIVKVATPNDPSKPDETTTITLSAAERDELAAIVASSELTASMAKGFACQGGGRDPDATLELAFEGHVQHVEYCVRGAGENLAVRIERLVRR